MNGNVWGHRGCRGPGNPPENSLGAFQSAIESGVGGIELDVHLSKDSAAVVFHDTGLERMTGAVGEVTSLTLPELKKLRLLTVEKHLSKESIPTLNEVLDLVDRRRQSARFVVNIEIKDPCSAQAAAEIVQRRITMGWSRENFLISSFEMAASEPSKRCFPRCQ